MELIHNGVYLTPDGERTEERISREEAKTHTMAYGILAEHNHGRDMEQLELKFDSLVSPDNNYVSILQTARASGLKKFPVPYVLSNCHHTLCAVGGTINQDDHVFGMDNVKKYGGIFLPPYAGILHQYMRERMAGCGKMILGSDSHTRYGALGTMGIGEGGGEIVKQLLGRTYDIAMPSVLAVRLTGKPKPGIGPMDVALTIIGKTFANGFTKNKILEFIGGGIRELSVEFRMGIDVMMTESAALSSIWMTDEKVREYLKLHGREEEYRELRPTGTAYYDGMIDLDLSEVECMMALPFHPSNTISIREFKKNPEYYLKKMEEEGNRIKNDPEHPFSVMDHIQNGEFIADQALIGGCAGGMYENICVAADILEGSLGQELSLGINPASLPIFKQISINGVLGRLVANGASIRPCICGGCFGVTDVPADNQISLRHMTRNYANREGSKPGIGQMAAAILMDARSIAATVRNHGRLMAATELDVEERKLPYEYDRQIYEKWVADYYGNGDPDHELRMGPNIADWPEMYAMGEHLLLKAAGVYEGSVTTDDLIPSGDASSYRSNPYKISDYMLISLDPEYRDRAKKIRSLDEGRRNRGVVSDQEIQELLERKCRELGCAVKDITIGGLTAADVMGDGSSREQAASSQRVLGGCADLAHSYATKRYRSNLINWGILPLQTEEALELAAGDLLFIRDVRKQLEAGAETLTAEVLTGRKDGQGAAGKVFTCSLGSLTTLERNILLKGCLINYYQYLMGSSMDRSDRPSVI